ncbi:hypothetical protein AB835_08090 [Candidatus Endobugula sertula]|uniref:Type II secretion system protein GspC N-terminal domain-containing protein n=1 Tax=Candidatus Endobugula sertula TaxID=62101 RepID=A0A1D2QPV7_9GAMM|nr:hypothetical protein AB835_08090 [Candidatus Endobugula sertula]
MRCHLPQITLTLSMALLLGSSFTFAGVDELPPPDNAGGASAPNTGFEQYGGTVQHLIDKKRQGIEQQPPAPDPASDTPPTVDTGAGGTTYYPPIVFVGMYEQADGDRVAEIYFRGNILQYRKKETLPNKEVITHIDDRALTTNQQQYWLSPTPTAPETSPSLGEPQVPLGLIQ